jgi:hypothetical protein
MARRRRQQVERHGLLTCTFESGCRDLNPGPRDPQAGPVRWVLVGAVGFGQVEQGFTDPFVWFCRGQLGHALSSYVDKCVDSQATLLLGVSPRPTAVSERDPQTSQVSGCHRSLPPRTLGGAIGRGWPIQSCGQGLNRVSPMDLQTSQSVGMTTPRHPGHWGEVAGSILPPGLGREQSASTPARGRAGYQSQTCDLSISPSRWLGPWREGPGGDGRLGPSPRGLGRVSGAICARSIAWEHPDRVFRRSGCCRLSPVIRFRG